jgi:hypothetical protein
MVPGLPIGTRASEENAESKLLRAGATSVISPYAYTGQRLARLLTRPKIQRFIEQTLSALLDENHDLEVAELSVDPGCMLAGAQLAETDSRFELGVTILAMRPNGGELKFHPKWDQSSQSEMFWLHWALPPSWLHFVSSPLIRSACNSRSAITSWMTAWPSWPSASRSRRIWMTARGKTL